MSDFVPGLVSLVSPVYNGEKYLHKLLDSVLSQTWGAVEVILSDDGSTDNTVEKAESYRERLEEKGYTLKVLRGEHCCAAAAVSSALAFVRGEFLIWPDSDDELAPDSIEKRVNFLCKYPHYDCVRSLSEYRDFETGQPAPAAEQTGDLDNENLFFDILESKTYVCCGCYILRSEEFFKLYPERRIPVYDVGQNFQMLLPFMYGHRCHTLREVLYRVNVRQTSHSNRRLSEEQERKKYADYESLLDDVIRIAGITDEKDLRRIECWKLERRYRLSQKYKDARGMRKASRRLYRLGEIPAKRYYKRLILSFGGRKMRKAVRRASAYARRN